MLKQSVLAVKSHPQAAPAPVYQLDPVLIVKWRGCQVLSEGAAISPLQPRQQQVPHPAAGHRAECRQHHRQRNSRRHGGGEHGETGKNI